MDSRNGLLHMLLLLITLTPLVLCQPLEGSTVKRDVESQPYISKPIVYLTVSSLTSTSGKNRLLEMNWENMPEDMLGNEEAGIHLYDMDPSLSESRPLISVIPSRKGYFRTLIKFPEHIFTKNNLTDACLDFWITLQRNNEVLSTNCLRAQPNWMHDARSTLGNLSLIDMMIPGTHNAGSYASFDPEDDTLFNRYLYTQEENIFNQLVYGVRYLDLRVAYRKTSGSREHFWITHSSFRTDITVREVIRQVKEFLNATKEIVIMDFHRFVTGFQNKRSPAPRRRHRELYTMLEQELGEYMIPAYLTTEATLNQLWDANKRLYVGYADERARTQSMFLFPAIKHLWGDVDEVDDLKSYLNETVCSPTRRRLTSAMAQLTPTTTGVLFNVYGSLRKMADHVNRQVTKWFRNDWNQCANIVATDFFHGNNIIELAIETNIKRSAQIEFLRD